MNDGHFYKGTLNIIRDDGAESLTIDFSLIDTVDAVFGDRNPRGDGIRRVSFSGITRSDLWFKSAFYKDARERALEGGYIGKS